MRLARTCSIAFCAAIMLLAQGASRAEPVKIRVSWIAPLSNWASLLMEKKDLARHMGTSYVLEPVRYSGTPQQITALANNELEVANLAYTTLPIAIHNAGLSDLRVIADELQDGIPGYYSQEYMVLKDGPVQRIEDMKGRVMAINAAGGAVDIAMRKMLRTKGLEVNRDFVQIEAPLPSMRAILADKKADMVPLVVPFSFDPELRKIAKPLFLNSDVMGVTQLLFWTARKSFIDKNRAAMVDFMEDTLRITTWFLDPKNHAEVIAIASRVTKQPPERLGWVFTNKDYHHAAGMRPDLVALQRNVALVKELGLTDKDTDVAKYSDLSLLDEAAKRLK
ncbi:MAG TPA: ABC transporter substrate-binding protein [Pseudolabrys sp.]|jgi:NitT/TauT family transport system substrate-binding protein|nr:ABC transporter substrate-binding protein [Pseudolabrys sp.]HEX2536967.1 ABC transporter substrate-binding protein [Pseudolabrys sp.]